MKSSAFPLVVLFSGIACHHFDDTEKADAARTNQTDKPFSCDEWPADAQLRAERLIALINDARSAGATCADSASTVAPSSMKKPALLSFQPARSLTCAARKKSAEMAATGHFAHRGLAGDGPSERTRRAGYTGHHVLENLAWGQESEAAVFQSWHASPSHCKVMLGASGDEVGAAVMLGAGSKRFWTLLIGSRTGK